LYESDFRVKINKRFGLHELKEALEFYKENSSAGKVILKPSLTKSK